jgi:hypothetical protein
MNPASLIRGALSNIQSLSLAENEAQPITRIQRGKVISYDWSTDGKLMMEEGSRLEDATQFTTP